MCNQNNKDLAVRPLENIEGGFLVWKELGETPLETLGRVRVELNLGPKVKMTYAGRLDPAAEGELLVLVGEACKRKEEFLGVDKTYRFKVLLGFCSDTLDLLGKVIPKSHEPFLESKLFEQAQIPNPEVTSKDSNHYGISRNTIIDKTKVELSTESFEGIKKLIDVLIDTHDWPYPAYSSKTFLGKPMWQYARDGEYQSLIDADSVPRNQFEVYGIKFINDEEVLGQDLLSRVKLLCDNVTGDFRQSVILQSWQDVVKPNQRYKVLEFEANVSSGTYIRQLALQIGNQLGVDAVTFSLIRTKINIPLY